MQQPTATNRSWLKGHCIACASQARGLDRPGMILLALLFAALMWPGLVCMALVSGDDSPMAAWPALLFGFATGAALLLLTARVWLNLLLVLPLLLFQPVEWHAVHTVHSQVSPAMFAVFFLTNVGEASDFLADRWWAVAVGALTVTIVLGGAWWTMWRRRVTVPLRLRLSLVLPLLVAAGTVAIWRSGSFDGIRVQAAAAPFTGSAVRFVQMLAQRREVGALAAQRAGYRHDAVAVRDERQLVILVLGESLRADRLQINGYARPTTPRLAARSGLITLTDVAACSHLTNLALPPALTGIRADDHPLMNRRSSLVAASREAGFATRWLSNQAPTGRWDELVASYAGEADEVRWMNPAPLVSEWGRYRAYDDKLLAPAAEAIDRLPGKALIVLHTLGSHLRYELRYPPEQAVFQPATEPGAGESYAAQPERMRNAYDNSVLTTDALLDACIALHERSGRPGFVMFIADHGESLLDDASKFLCHGNLPPPAVEFRVPWLLWPSPEERRLHPQAWAAVEGNRHKRVSTQDAFQTLLHLAGIAIREADPRRCLGSPEYAEQPRMLIDIGGRLMDFDREVEVQWKARSR